MTEQLTTTNSSVEGDERGLDRRKFLLRTTAITAGAWAAPSILTIDKAFGTHGSPHTCPCEPAETDAATAKGEVFIPGQVDPLIVVRENACLNDDQLGTAVALPASLGTVQLLEASCECGARVRVGHVTINLPDANEPITANALESNAECNCETNAATGGSRVVGLRAFGTTVVDSTAFQAIPIDIPGATGFVFLNETRAAEEGGTEFNAVRIVFTNLAGSRIDLAIASSRVEC